MEAPTMPGSEAALPICLRDGIYDLFDGLSDDFIHSSKHTLCQSGGSDPTLAQVDLPSQMTRKHVRGHAC